MGTGGNEGIENGDRKSFVSKNAFTSATTNRRSHVDITARNEIYLILI